MQTADSADLRHARRLQHIAGNYRYLQGLVMLPFVPVFTAVFILEMFLPNHRAALRSPTTAAVVAAAAATVLILGTGAIIGAILIGGYYRRRFGHVTPSTRARVAGAIVGGVGAFGFNYTLNASLIPVGIFQLGPVNTGMLLIAFAFGMYWLLTGRFLTHYLVLAVMGLGVGLLPLLGVHLVGRWWYLREVTLYMLLLALIGGYLDHRILVKSLPVGTTSA